MEGSITELSKYRYEASAEEFRHYIETYLKDKNII